MRDIIRAFITGMFVQYFITQQIQKMRENDRKNKGE